MSLAEPLSDSLTDIPSSSALPWILVLANGAKCVNAGNVGEEAGVVLVYQCLGGGAASEANTGSTVWTTQYLASNSDTLVVVDISTAWN